MKSPTLRSGRGTGLAFFLLLSGILCLLLLQFSASAAEPIDLVHVAASERRSGDLVVTNKSLSIDGTVAGTVVAISSEVRLAGHVTGDLILLGGNLLLSDQGHVDGSVLALGAGVVSPQKPAATSVGGRLLNVAALEAAFLTELRTSPLRAEAVSPLLLSFRVLILLAWLAAGSLLLIFGSRRVASAAAALPGRAPLLALVGTSTVLSALLVSVFLLSNFPARASLPLVAVIVFFVAAAKVFGLVALLLVLGRVLNRRARRGKLFFGDPAAFALGLLALGLVSLVPAAGAIAWAAASLIGIGVALLTSFGRMERAFRLG
ncbi:MAG: hypothetical protein ABIT01_08260 [Thermoanaerobaculia bacterium]